MGKGFFVVGAGLLQVPMIREAKEMGFTVYVTDGNPDAPGFDIADHYAVMSTYDLRGTANIVRQFLKEGHSIAGVATCGADVAPTVSTVAGILESPCLPLVDAVTTHNKYLVRWTLLMGSLVKYQPHWNIMKFSKSRELGNRIVKTMEEWDGLVIKPLRERASRGIMICRTEEDVHEGLKRLEPFIDGLDDFLVEELMTGSEHSAEIIYRAENRPVFFNIVDRIFDYRDGVAMEMGHVSPSSLDREQWAQVRGMVESAARALNVKWGPFKCDVMFTKDGPKILECTARLSGGFDCQETIYMSGRNPIRQVIRLAAGEQTALREETSEDFSFGAYDGFYGACKAAFPKPGVVRALPREDVIRGCLGVRRVHVVVKRGDVIQSYKHCAQRPGFVITEGRNYEEAWIKAIDASQVMANEFEIAYVGDS